MGKNTTSIRFPDALVEALDRRAAALGLTRSEIVVQAVEKALADRSAWSPAFLKAIGTPRPELEELAEEVMSAVRQRRTRSRGLRL